MYLPFTIDDLNKALTECLKKKSTSIAALDFMENKERNMAKLYNDLIDGSYTIGTSICFVVTEPKCREIWAGSFRDRIVHHLIYIKFKNIFLNTFINDSYACIHEKGTLYGAKRIEKFTRQASHNYSKDTWFLKADISNFFGSIDKKILDCIISKKVKEPFWIDLIRKIIYHDPKTNYKYNGNRKLLKLVPPHKSLFNTRKDVGLPIGNLTSQFFANIYMNELDQYCKHVLKIKFYGRYVDDMVLIGNSSEELLEKYNLMQKFVETNLNIKFHPSKMEINKIEHGINFIGFIIKPYRKYLRQSTLDNMYRKLNEFDMIYGGATDRNAGCMVNSYLGFLKHVNGYNQRLKLQAAYPQFSYNEDISKIIIPPPLF